MYWTLRTECGLLRRRDWLVDALTGASHIELALRHQDHNETAMYRNKSQRDLPNLGEGLILAGGD